MATKRKTDKQNLSTDDKPKKDYSWLRKFQPGQSGNPLGRPPGIVSLAHEIKTIGDEEIDNSGLTYLHALIRKMFQEAIDGDKDTRRELFDRGFGTLIQKNMIVGLTGEIVKFARELGLDDNDITGSDTVRGLLEAGEIHEEGYAGVETNSGLEATTGEGEGSTAASQDSGTIA
jgi:hypothetical protein